MKHTDVSRSLPQSTRNFKLKQTICVHRIDGELVGNTKPEKYERSRIIGHHESERLIGSSLWALLERKNNFIESSRLGDTKNVYRQRRNKKGRGKIYGYRFIRTNSLYFYQEIFFFFCFEVPFRLKPDLFLVESSSSSFLACVPIGEIVLNLVCYDE